MTNADLDHPESRWAGTRSVALAEVSLEVEILGTGDPVLLLHGFPTTRALWAAVAPALAAAGHRVIMLDILPGGHFLPIDNPAALATVLTDFLATLSARHDAPQR